MLLPIILTLCITSYCVLKLFLNWYSDPGLPDHIHEWELLSKTYQPGITPINIKGVGGEALETVLEAMQDKTTYLFQCQDEVCRELHRELHTEILYGKEVQTST